MWNKYSRNRQKFDEEQLLFQIYLFDTFMEFQNGYLTQILSYS